jgi:hypothetical protein
MTKKELAESILLEYYGGPPSDDAVISLRQVGVMINKALAEVAKKSFYDNANIEGIAYANDEFTVSFDVTLNAADNTGFKWFNLPTAPVGLPKSRGVVYVGPRAGIRNAYKKVPANLVSIYTNKEIPGTVIYWIEGTKVYVYALDASVVMPTTLKVRTVGSDANDMDAELGVTLDATADITRLVLAQLRAGMGAMDTINDNLDIKDVR